MELQPLTDRSDKNSYFLSIYLKKLGLSAVVFITSVATTTLLMMSSGRSETLDVAFTQPNLGVIPHAKIDTVAHKSNTPTEAADVQLVDLDESNWHNYTVKSEGNLFSLASGIGLDGDEIQSILMLGSEVEHLNNLYYGDKLKINFSSDKRIMALEYDIHDAKRLRIDRIKAIEKDHASFKTVVINRPLTMRTIRLTGVISKSLYQAARTAGLTKSQTMELVRIFDCNIDYSRDIKKGDTFTVVYEQQYRGNEKISDSPILAAEFVNDNKAFNAIRYAAPGDKPRYYTQDGISLHKQFLRNPVDYPLISSGFNPARQHPLLHRIRAHRGVDYAAKRGTPIKATGDGFLQSIGRKGSYGNTIVIQHGNEQSTLYAHLYKYAEGLKEGARIRQGDIIGYVGKTGRATGTHLHYEFRIKGKHVDPLKLSHPIIAVPDKHKYDFLMKSHLLLSQVRSVEQFKVAWNASADKISSLN